MYQTRSFERSSNTFPVHYISELLASISSLTRFPPEYYFGGRKEKKTINHKTINHNSLFAMDFIKSVINILASQAFDTLMQNFKKVVLFVMSLPLIYFVHNRWEAEKLEREKEIRQADQDWTREIRQADQDWARETLYQKWLGSYQNRYAAGTVNGSGGIVGLQQALEIWKLTHPSENIQNDNPYSSQVLRAKAGGPNTDADMLYPWYLYVMLTIICWVILSAIIGFYVKKLRIM